jgi:Excalibur calcium-binding domain
MRRSATIAVLAATVAACVLAGVTQGKTVPPTFKNCTALNKVYPHGVGRAGAVDKTKSKTSGKVTDFKRSTRLYNTAIGYNPRLDGDKDGIACEKH